MDDAEPRLPPPSWLDKDFIQRALRAGEEDPIITVTSYEVKAANATGDGYTSDLYRLIAKIENSHERSMIVKCHPQGGIREQVVRLFGAFQIETSILTETLPAMNELLEKARPGKYQPFGPKCLFHGKNPTEFLVLEDLRQSGFTLAKRQLGLDLNHCTLMMKTLGRYHATSLALYDRNPEIIARYDKAPFCEETIAMLAPVFLKAVRYLTNEVAKWPGYEKYVPKLNNLNETIDDRFLGMLKRKNDEFNTLSHGDAWTTNIMFKYSGEVPQDIRLIDFQRSYFCSPGLDLQYFLNSCPNLDVRMYHIDNLLQVYHSTLTETLDILGCSKYVISFSKFQEMYKGYSFYGFCNTITMLPMALADPESALDVEEALSKDNDSNDNNSKMYSNVVFVQIMKYMLPLFDEAGLLE